MREKLIELIQSAVGGCATYWASLIADKLIANGVTIPVRCKDCAVPHNRFTGCPKLNGLIPPQDFYCVYGERRTDA